MADEVIQVELPFFDWMGAVAQRILKMKENVFNHKDSPEEYNPMVKSLFRVWRNGEYPIYETKMTAIPETSVQNSLFTDKTTEKSNGIKIVNTTSEPIKTE